MEVGVEHCGGVDSISFDDFERLGEKRGNCACESGGVEAQGGLVFDG